MEHLEGNRRHRNSRAVESQVRAARGNQAEGQEVRSEDGEVGEDEERWMLRAGVRRRGTDQDRQVRGLPAEQRAQDEAVRVRARHGPQRVRSGLPRAGRVRVQQRGQPVPAQVRREQRAPAGHAAAAADVRVRRLRQVRGVRQEAGAGNHQLDAVPRRLRIDVPVAHRGRRPAVGELHAPGRRQDMVQHSGKLVPLLRCLKIDYACRFCV